jgi:hypothetical protein
MGTLNTFALTIRNALTVAVLIFGALLGFAGTAHAHGTHVAPAPTPQVRQHHQGPFSVLHGPFSALHEGPFSASGPGVRP